jgi:hypothetical protein
MLALVGEEVKGMTGGTDAATKLVLIVEYALDTASAFGN